MKYYYEHFNSDTLHFSIWRFNYHIRIYIHIPRKPIKPWDTKFNFSSGIPSFLIKRGLSLVPITCLIAYGHSIHKLNVVVGTIAINQNHTRQRLHHKFSGYGTIITTWLKMKPNGKGSGEWSHPVENRSLNGRSGERKESKLLVAGGQIYRFDQGSGQIKMLDFNHDKKTVR